MLGKADLKDDPLLKRRVAKVLERERRAQEGDDDEDEDGNGEDGMGTNIDIKSTPIKGGDTPARVKRERMSRARSVVPGTQLGGGRPNRNTRGREEIDDSQRIEDEDDDMELV